MAVDQARHLNFFREILSTNNNNNNNSIQIANNLYSSSNITSSLGLGGGAVLPATLNDSLLPFYSFNDVVLQQNQLSGAGKIITPAVKDDSGVTFNNSLVPRKRPREPTVLAPAPISGVTPSLLTVSPIGNCNIVKKESNNFSFLGDDISFQIMRQQSEIDRLISQHMEKMRMDIENQKKQQFRGIMASIEEAMGRRLREKDEQIDKIGKINWALEERIKSLCIENQIWRDLAQTNEATANALRTNLEEVLHQVKNNVDRTAGAGEMTDDAVSCCGSSGYGGGEEIREEEDDNQRSGKRICYGKAQDEEEGKNWVYRGKNESNNTIINSGGGGNNNSKRLCRKCGEGESSVLLLPCRHLCLCTSCGPAVNTCPLCNSVKNASVHVNLS